MLSVDGFTVKYGSIVAVKNISFHINPGEIVSILGANGAGKTSLLRGIMGLERANYRDLIVMGTGIRDIFPHQMVKRGVAIVPEGRRVFSRMSVEDNLLTGGHLNGNRRTDLDRIYSLFPRLSDRRKQLAGSMSGGEQQMVAIGRALMARPKLLFLDEPTLGLAPKIVEQIGETIQALRKRGIGIILVEQNSELALSIAGRSYIMRSGEIVHEVGENDEIDSAKLWSLYLDV